MCGGDQEHIERRTGQPVVQPAPVMAQPAPVMAQPVGVQLMEEQQRQQQQQGGGQPVPVLQQQGGGPVPIGVVQQQVVPHGPVQDYSNLQRLSQAMTATGFSIADNSRFFNDIGYSRTLKKSEGLFSSFSERSKDKEVKALQSGELKEFSRTHGMIIKRVENFAVSFNKLKDKMDAEDILPLREKDARLVRFMLPFANDLNTLDNMVPEGKKAEYQRSLSLNIARFYREFSVIKRRVDAAAIAGPAVGIPEYEDAGEMEKAETLKKAKEQASTFLHREEDLKTHQDDGQLATYQQVDLRELDKWMVTHAHDSGSPFEKIVDTLLQKTDRERFLIYYLIANKKEDSGNIGDCIRVVVDARININTFEKAMSSSFKVFRTKAGAYRWEKVERAMQTGLGLSLSFSMVSKALGNDVEGNLQDKLTELNTRRDAELRRISTDANLSERQRTDQTQTQEQIFAVEEAGLYLLDNGNDLIRTLSQIGPNGPNPAISQMAADKINVFIESFERYHRVSKSLEASAGSKFLKKQGLVGKVSGVGSSVLGAVTSGTMASVTSNLAPLFGKNDADTLEKVKEVLEPLTKAPALAEGWAMSGLSVLSGLTGIVSGVAMLVGAIGSAKSDDWSENFVKFTGAINVLTGGVKCLVAGAKTTSLMSMALVTTNLGKDIVRGLGTAAPYLGYVKVGTDFLSMTANSVSVVKRGHNISSAVKKLQQQPGGFDVEHSQSEEAKLLRLSKNIKKKKTCDAIVSGVSLAFSIAGVSPIGLLASACVTGVGIVTTFALDKLLSVGWGPNAIKEKAINDIFNPVALFGQDEVTRMKPKELNKRIKAYAEEAAASFGMSKDRFFNAIICQHAENVYQKLFFNDQGGFSVDPDNLTDVQKIYSDIAGSYGCSVRFNRDINKCRPTKETLISKMGKM